MRIIQILVCATAMCGLAASGVSAQIVPAEYQDLNGELSANLNRFRDALAQQWDGSRAPVAFSANLLAAHSARADALLQTGVTDAVRLSRPLRQSAFACGMPNRRRGRLLMSCAVLTSASTMA